MNQVYNANGKILLTGEYLVVDGAKALVLPLVFGQKLSVKNNPSVTNRITWKSFQLGNLWFQCEIDFEKLEIIKTTDEQIAEKLLRIFKEIIKVNRKVFHSEGGKEFETELDFPQNWGWGSSSTLLVLLSQWSGTDPFKLYFQLFSGSAYDIAAAYNTKPFFYWLQNNQPVIQETSFNPLFKDYLYFVFLGKKQLSEQEIKHYKLNYRPDRKLINRISEISENVAMCNELVQFERLITEHEEIMSCFLRRPSVKMEMFSDYAGGAIKSLGAWGGDFVLFTCFAGRKYLEEYLKGKNLFTCFNFSEIVSN